MKLTKAEVTVRRRDNSLGWARGNREFNSATRVYVDFPGETVLDNLANRRSRPFTALKPFVKKALATLGLDTDVKVRWSQKAGCNCGCSPGFVLDRTLRSLDGPVDVWFTVGEPKAAEVITEGDNVCPL
jgi:hypothetical protein